MDTARARGASKICERLQQPPGAKVSELYSPSWLRPAPVSEGGFAPVARWLTTVWRRAASQPLDAPRARIDIGEGRRSALVRVFAAFISVLFSLAFSPFPTDADATPTPTIAISLKVQADIVYYEGDALYQQKNWQAAQDKFNQALVLYRRAGDRLGEGYTLEYIAWTYDQMKQYDQASSFYLQAITIYEEAGNRKAMAPALTYLGDVYVNQGFPSKALDVYQKALLIWRELGDRTQEAQTIENIGYAHAIRAEYSDALSYYEQALPMWRVLTNRIGEARTLTLMGETYRSLAQYEKAHTVFRQSLDIRRAIGHRVDEALSLNQIGFTYLRQGEYARALQYFQQALALWRETKQRQREGLVLRNIALTYEKLGQDDKALALSEEALPIEREVADRYGELLTLRRMGEILVRQGHIDQAVRLWEQAVAIIPEVNDWTTISPFLHDLGLVYQRWGSYDQALEVYLSALDLRRQASDPLGEGDTLHAIASLYHAQKQHDKALDYYQQALAVRREMGDRKGEAETLGEMGLLYDDQADLPRALDFYQQAITVGESIISAAALEELKVGLVEQAADAYAGAILVLTRLNRPEQAFDLSERARARIFLDQLSNARLDVYQGSDAQLAQQEQSLRQQLAILEDALRQEQAKPAAQRRAEVVQALSSQIVGRQRDYQDLLTRLKLNSPEYATLVSVSPLMLPDVQKLLDKQTTLLSYFVAESQTLAFIVTGNGLRMVELAITADDLNTAVTELRDFASLEEIPPPSLTRLYDWLVAPLKEHLKTPLIGIVPHGVLHYVPFAALSDGKRYLGEQYTLFHLPSASSLPFVQQKRKAVEGSLLVMAYGEAQGLPTLHYANEEVQAIARLYATEPLVGSAASEPTFVSRSTDSTVIHLAAHAQLNTVNPLFSRIVLAPEADSDGALTVADVYGLNLQHASLVVLSACQTQLGMLGRGDDIIGLTRAFIYAGSPTVIASLWSVDDQATGLLMTSFYKHLKHGKGKAAALRAAQAETRTRYPHPYYWAAFVLTGDAGEATSSALPWCVRVALVFMAVALVLLAALVVRAGVTARKPRL